jgi:hypothetical protein
MIDGVENNDISVAGPALLIRNPDAVQEVSVQTSQFSAEYGRAGGGVFNQITKSGTNSLHGTASHVFMSSRLNALSNSERLADLKKPAVFVRNIPSFTVGGRVGWVANSSSNGEPAHRTRNRRSVHANHGRARP